MGSLVEPDVYCRNARSDSLHDGRLEMFGQFVGELVGGDPLAGGSVGREQLGVERRERGGGGERDVGVAVDRDAIEPRHRSPRFGIGGRHRDDAGVQAAKKRRDEIEARRIHQQRAVARLELELQPRRDHAGPAIQLAVGHVDRAVAVIEKDVGGTSRIVGRLLGEDVRHRAGSNLTTHRHAIRERNQRRKSAGGRLAGHSLDDAKRTRRQCD